VANFGGRPLPAERTCATKTLGALNAFPILYPSGEGRASQTEADKQNQLLAASRGCDDRGSTTGRPVVEFGVLPEANLKVLMNYERVHVMFIPAGHQERCKGCAGVGRGEI